MSLANAIIFGELDDVKKHISSNTDLNDYDEYGYSPLIEAVIAQKPDIVRFLLEQDLNLEFHDSAGRTALHWAIDNNDEEIAELLLIKGANPNSYTRHSQPAATMAYLRDNTRMLFLLESYGVDMNFVKDYVYTKLIAHRYALKGKVDILSSRKQFLEVNLEGFILESSLLIVYHSFKQFVNHFAGREFQQIRTKAKCFIEAFEQTEKLMRYQHYHIDPTQHRKKIEAILQKNILLLPVAYKGHAICFLRVGNLLAKCDRGEYGRKHGALTIYQIQNPKQFNFQLIERLFFNSTSKTFVHREINKILGLKKVMELEQSHQITGNCSWANIEGIIPAGLFMLLSQDSHYSMDACRDISLDFYHQWVRFDQRRALDDTIDRFFQAPPARRASIAALLSAVLFQYCSHLSKSDIVIAEKIGRIFQEKDYRYLLKAYLKIYRDRHHCDSGKRFEELLAVAGID